MNIDEKIKAFDWNKFKLSKKEIEKAEKVASKRNGQPTHYAGYFLSDIKPDEAGFLRVVMEMEGHIIDGRCIKRNIIYNICIWDRRHSFIDMYDYDI